MRRSTAKYVSNGIDWLFRIVGLIATVFAIGPNFQNNLGWWNQAFNAPPQNWLFQMPLLQIGIGIVAVAFVLFGNVLRKVYSVIVRAFRTTEDLEALHRYEITVAALDYRIDRAKRILRLNALDRWYFGDWKEQTQKSLRDNLGEESVTKFNDTLRGAESINDTEYLRLAINYLDDLAGKLTESQFHHQPSTTQHPDAG